MMINDICAVQLDTSERCISNCITFREIYFIGWKFRGYNLASDGLEYE